MDQFAVVIVLIIFFGLVFGVGEWLFRTLADRLNSRLYAAWRWLTLPIVAFICFAAFLPLRPLIVDQPQTPSWFLIGLIAVALLVAGATALGYAIVDLGRWIVSVLGSR